MQNNATKLRSFENHKNLKSNLIQLNASFKNSNLNSIHFQGQGKCLTSTRESSMCGFKSQYHHD